MLKLSAALVAAVVFGCSAPSEGPTSLSVGDVAASTDTGQVGKYVNSADSASKVDSAGDVVQTCDCDDGNLCTTDSCVAGQCQHESVFCGHEGDDGSLCCEVFFCELTTGICNHKPNPDCEGCGGGGGDEVKCVADSDCPVETNKCLPQVCEAGSCVFRGIDCDDGNPCTNDACKKEVGCLNQPVPYCKPVAP